MEFQIFINKVSNGSIIEIRSYLNERDAAIMEFSSSVEIVCQQGAYDAYNKEEELIVSELKKIYRSAKEAERANNQPATQSEKVD